MQKQKVFVIFILQVVFFYLHSTVTAQNFTSQILGCGYQIRVDQQTNLDTSILHRLTEINHAIEESLRKGVHSLAYRSDAVDPIVIHVVFSHQEEQVSDYAILLQIETLNQDFNGENFDLGNIPEDFKLYIAQEGIRFCLASEDPNGFPNSGIVRVRRMWR